jgi:hypothetical protein
MIAVASVGPLGLTDGVFARAASAVVVGPEPLAVPFASTGPADGVLLRSGAGTAEIVFARGSVPAAAAEGPVGDFARGSGCSAGITPVPVALGASVCDGAGRDEEVVRGTATSFVGATPMRVFSSLMSRSTS